MHVSKERFDLSTTDKVGIDTFEEWIRHNSEVCNHCFSRVRAIGEEQSVRKDIHTHHVNDFYERTDNGTQENHPFQLPSNRYGTTFCRACGGDLAAGSKNIPFPQFKEYALNIHEYIKRHTPLSMDHVYFGREAARLKRQPEHQGRGRELLALAFARALDMDTRYTASGATDDDRLRADGG